MKNGCLEVERFFKRYDILRKLHVFPIVGSSPGHDLMPADEPRFCSVDA
jgi:hypothetical protein